MNFYSKNQLIKIVLAIIALIVIIGVIFFVFKREAVESEVIVKEDINYFDGILLEAKSAYVWDMKKQKVLFSKNEESQLPLASITKLMTAYITSDLVPENTIITISNDDLQIEGENGFSIGEKWNLKDLLDLTLMSSSNDGAHALASVIGFVESSVGEKTTEEMFLEKMNSEAKKMGLTQTFFLNESGLDINEKLSGAYGSAKDVAILMKNILEEKSEILESTRYSRLDINSKEAVYLVENTNQDVDVIPGVIGSKTGFTDLAGGNLVIAFDVGIGYPVIVSVLGASKEGRFEDVRRLVDASINTIAFN